MVVHIQLKQYQIGNTTNTCTTVTINKRAVKMTIITIAMIIKAVISILIEHIHIYTYTYIYMYIICFLLFAA